MDWLRKLDDDFIQETIMTEMGKSPYIDKKRSRKIADTVIILKKKLEEYMTHSKGIYRKIADHEHRR